MRVEGRGVFQPTGQFEVSERIRKAVLPVAGLGTRILPAAKTTPKNMLNVFDRPILAHVVAEARAAGIEHLVFVVGRGQGAIEDYFDHAYELESQLEAKGKTDILDAVRADLLAPGAFQRRAADGASAASATRSGARATSSATSPSR